LEHFSKINQVSKLTKHSVQTTKLHLYYSYEFELNETSCQELIPGNKINNFLSLVAHHRRWSSDLNEELSISVH
jgi:hypothetical protein